MFQKITKTLLIFFLVFVLNSTLVVSQTVSGKVISKSNKAISFATIQIGENYGVISNEEGSFSIDINGFNKQDSVKISCLGYEKLTMILDNFKSQDYILNEKINELSEVLITNKSLSLDSILFYVKNNLDKNYRFYQNEFKLFSRKTEYIVGDNADFEIKKSTGFKKKQLALFNADFDKLETSLLNNKSKQYTDFVGNLKILDETNAKLQVEKAIRLLDQTNNQSFESLFEKGNDIVLKHLDKDKLYTVKSGLFKISDSVSLDKGERKMEDTINSLGHVKNVSFDIIKNHNFISENPKLDFISDSQKYKFVLKDVTYLDNELVYIIAFSPKRSSAKYSGTMYVSNGTFAVLRVDYQFYKNRTGDKFNLKLLLGIKYVEKNQRGFVVYKQDTDGFYYPNYINQQVDRYFYLDRPIKFIENPSRANKVSFNFKIEGTFKEKTELLILSRNQIDATKFNNYKELSNIDYQTPKVYDPSIWADYNVIEPLNDMKNFKVEN